jgi:nucleotide-binding universal stress UspA family protein
MTNNAGRIVVGVDGSPSSLQALRWAVGQSALTGETVQAVVAWHFPNLYGYPMTDGEDWAMDAQQALTTALDTVLGNDKSKVSSTVVQGYPAKVLLDAAAGADLLVVGNRGHSEFTEMLLGSVSQNVVTHATCPVLVIRQVPTG